MLMCGFFFLLTSDCCTHAHSNFREAMITCDKKCVKGKVHPIIKKTYFCRDLLTVEMSAFSQVKTKLDVTHLVLPKTKKTATIAPLFRNHDLATQNNPLTQFWPVLCRNYFPSTELHRNTARGLWS